MSGIFEALPVDQIVVEGRHRKEFSDIEGLARSINQLGLLQPIGVDDQMRLVYGERRLKAVQLLGWKHIIARRGHYDALKRLEAEYAENFQRKSFTHSEMVDIVDAIKAQIEQGEIPKDPEFDSARDQAAAQAKVSVGQYERAKEVVESGDEETIQRMDAGELKPHAAQQEVRKKGKSKKKLKKKGRKRAAQPAPEALKDIRGTPVPDSLKDAFGDQTLMGVSDLFGQAAGLLDGISKWNYWLPAEVALKVRELAAVVRHQAPACVCAACGGSGCNQCRTMGWLAQWRYDELVMQGAFDSEEQGGEPEGDSHRQEVAPIYSR